MGSLSDNIQFQLSEGEKEEEQAFIRAMQIVTSVALPMTLKAAAELGLLEIIAKAGVKLSAEQVVSKMSADNLPCNPVAVDRMIKLLVSYSVISCTVEADDDGGVLQLKYGATPVLKYFTRNEEGMSMTAMGSFLLDQLFTESWYYLKDSVLHEEIPFKQAHGEALFERLGKDSRFNKIFNDAMSNATVIFMRKVLERYSGFSNAKVIVDVGGGTGLSLSMIITKYPHIKGLCFDLPHVISEAPSFQGVEHIGGDMFEKVPSGDTILMKWILHDWSDEHCIKILKNCWKALPDDGVVIIMESIVPAVPEPSLAAQSLFNMDLYMLAVCNGGKERTEEEFKSLANESGFSGFETLLCCAGTWLIRLSK